jgi:uncharacterized membrane protein
MSRDFTKGWVLQNESSITLSDYQKRALAESYARLSRQNQMANKDITEKYQKARVYEMSLKDLGENWVKSMGEISQEVYQWIALPADKRTIARLMEIIGREDRMIYVGITLVFASLFIYFMIMP